MIYFDQKNIPGWSAICIGEGKFKLIPQIQGHILPPVSSTRAYDGFKINSMSVVGWGFPRGGVNLLFGKIFAENCMGGGRIPSTP